MINQLKYIIIQIGLIFLIILIIGSSGSRKTNVLLNLIKHQQRNIDKIYLYIKDPLK